MKKALIVMLSSFLLIGLSACNKDNSENKAIGNATKSKETASQQTIDDQLPNGPANIEADAAPAGLEPLDDKPKTIVVSILGVNSFYKLAKEKYEALHPNTTIQFKEFTNKSMMSAADVEKYIKTTTTEVLSGKGADLFAFTTVDLPIDKYVNKGAFENVNDWIDRDAGFDPRQYHTNIMSGSKMNGGLYLMPIEFYLEALYGDAAGLKKAGIAIDDQKWTWSQFAEVSKRLADKNGQPSSIGFLPPEAMINNLVSDNYSRLIDGTTGKASFDTPYFKELLSEVKAMYDEKSLSGDAVTNSNFYYSLITSPSDYLLRLGMFFKDGKVYQKPHAADQQSGISFLVTNQIAMNANSEVKRDAWEFMKFLLSEEMQSYPKQPGSSGFSMNKAVNERAIEEVEANGMDQNVAAKGGGVTVEATEENLKAIRDMLSIASLRNIGYETTVQKIIAEEVKAFFTGQKSADAVAKLIQNRVSTYLNE
ncbi:ABC transporter substrate-binding protein [Paenibacillus silvisoli]|uniref:ABC transporter substrate-binding protein n=1 Tax=Paenibacillus silvisoli TaxID=3110539 RepID=UPI0028047295|nr:extracellular solute-binding protein [Paenibacillus silvisoli]